MCCVKSASFRASTIEPEACVICVTHLAPSMQSKKAHGKPTRWLTNEPSSATGKRDNNATYDKSNYRIDDGMCPISMWHRRRFSN